ncbi:MAG: NAD(P)H-hydrate dehydratase [Phycisphaerales bacterium]|jgi:NAD(P)H-hydrate epimerase|nr:NAD(P)H-hydrate dehydratase [Phycisphaerales bacterium]
MFSTDDAPLPALPARDPRGHKGTFGTVGLVGGCAMPASRMIGAPALAARGALRCGAGLVRLVTPAPVLDAAIGAEPSATGIALPTDASGAIVPHEAAEVLDDVLEKCDTLVIGCGMGEEPGAAALALRAVAQESVPIVVDAGAITALARTPEFWLDLRGPCVLTPHPGEFAHLAAALSIAGDATSDRDRPRLASMVAQRLGCVVVLKGAGTVVSDGLRAWTCARGHPCMGTAGTGDVLAGVIGAFAAFASVGPMVAALARAGKAPSGLSLYDAARMGVEAHARGGEAWALRTGAQAGMLARELADELPNIMDGMRSPA